MAERAAKSHGLTDWLRQEKDTHVEEELARKQLREQQQEFQD